MRKGSSLSRIEGVWKSIFRSKDTVIGQMENHLIHLKKKYQETLELQEFYGHIVSGLGEGIAWLDRSKYVVFANPSFEKLSGKDGLVGLTLEECFPNNTHQFSRLLVRAVEGTAAEEVRIPPNVVAHVSIRWVEESDGPSGFLVTLRDISEERFMQERLSHIERQLHTLYEMSPSMIFGLKPDGTFLYANPAMQRRCGWTESSVKSQQFCQVFETATSVYRKDIAPSDYGLSYPRKVRMQTFSGETALVMVNLLELESSEGFEDGYVGVAIDQSETERLYSELSQALSENSELQQRLTEANVTLENRVEEQVSDIENQSRLLERTNQSLREAERLRDLLTGTLVHDIKNCIFALISEIRPLSKRADYRQMELLAHMKFCCTAIMNLSANVMDVGQIEEGNHDVVISSITSTAIDQILRHICKDVVSVKDRVCFVPESPSNATVRADRYLIERVLQNLLMNAVMYSKVESRIRVVWSDANELQVIHGGSPVSEEHQKELFEKYARAGLDSSKYSKGLALYFCRVAMEAQNGSIRYDYTEDGNVFTLGFAGNKQQTIE